MAKTFGTDGKGQFSYFAVRLYAPKDRVLEAVEKMPIRHYAFIEHDKDTYKDSTEDHNKGDKKKTHIHAVLNLEQKTGWKALKKMIEHELGEKCGVQLRDIRETDSATLYLTHETEEAKKEGKHVYDRAEVITDNYEYWLSKETKQANKQEKEDILNSFITEVLEIGYISKEIYEKYRQKGGRDFIINNRFAVDYLCNLLNITKEGLFERPKPKTIDEYKQAVLHTVNCELEDLYMKIKPEDSKKAYEIGQYIRQIKLLILQD